jgi:hypothetical protein
VNPDQADTLVDFDVQAGEVFLASSRFIPPGWSRQRRTIRFHVVTPSASRRRGKHDPNRPE